MQAQLTELAARAEQICQHGSAAAKAKHLDKGKLLARTRIDLLLDKGSFFLEIGQFAAFKVYDEPVPAAGVVAGIGRVAGRLCMIVANDATVKGGTYYPLTVKKHCAPKTLLWHMVCLVFTWSIQVELIWRYKMRCFLIGFILAEFFIIKPIFLRQACHKLR